MAEIGLDISLEFPKRLTTDQVQAAEHGKPVRFIESAAALRARDLGLVAGERTGQ
jgi:hypothetical protein